MLTSAPLITYSLILPKLIIFEVVRTPASLPAITTVSAIQVKSQVLISKASQYIFESQKGRQVEAKLTAVVMGDRSLKLVQAVAFLSDKGAVEKCDKTDQKKFSKK